MSFDLMLKPSCGGCGATRKHLTLCCCCGKTMGENGAKCYECGTTLSRLMRDDDVDEEEESNEEDGGLSKSGTELKKLPGQANGLNDAYTNDEDDGSGKNKKDEEDDDEEVDDEDQPSPVLKDPKEEATAKPAPGESSSKSTKGKRKSNEDAKSAGNAAQKKVKTQNISSTKEDASEGGGAANGTHSPYVKTEGPFSEEEIRTLLLQRAPITPSDLVGRFRARLKSAEDKKGFTDILKRMSKIQKKNGQELCCIKGQVIRHAPRLVSDLL